jgi:hypothetical protein
MTIFPFEIRTLKFQIFEFMSSHKPFETVVRRDSLFEIPSILSLFYDWQRTRDTVIAGGAHDEP